MGLSIEEQRKKIRSQRNPKRFHKVSHLKVDFNKLKGNDKQRKNKIEEVYREVEKILGEDYYSNNKKPSKKLKKQKLKKRKQLTPKQLKYKEYLQSEDWIQLRIDLLKFRGYSCERCSYNKNLHVHHLHYNNIFNEEPKDLEIICSDCHKKEHNIK